MVKVYTTDACPWCVKAKNYLKSKNIVNAFKVYIKMIKYIPIMFNKDIMVYICYRLINKDICNY